MYHKQEDNQSKDGHQVREKSLTITTMGKFAKVA